MIDYTLEIELLSDTAFGMGAGISGLLDTEIQHDERGLPTLSGRAIKGLLVNECSEILYALNDDQRERWEGAALSLFGKRGEMLDDLAGVFIADATIAPDLAAVLHAGEGISSESILNSLTDIRRQTAMNEKGAPEDESLRAMRVLLRGLTLYASLTFSSDNPGKDEKALLAACVLSLRRAGLSRNRGKGKISARLTRRPLSPAEFAQTEEKHKDDNEARGWFKHFEQEVTKK